MPQDILEKLLPGHLAKAFDESERGGIQFHVFRRQSAGGHLRLLLGSRFPAWKTSIAMAKRMAMAVPGRAPWERAVPRWVSTRRWGPSTRRRARRDRPQ